MDIDRIRVHRKSTKGLLDVSYLVATVLSEVEKLRQTVQGAPGLEEVVANQLCSASSRLDVYAEADGKERLELLGELIGLLQTRGTVGGDEIEGLQRLLIQIWWLGLDHLDGHDTQRPDIDLVSVFLLLDNLWGHPVRGSDHSRTLASLLSELSTETEIG